MRVSKVFKIGILSGFLSLSTTSCKKAAYSYKPIQELPIGMSSKIDFMKSQSILTLRDKRYEFFGRDTLEITEDIFNGTRKYLNNLNKYAKKNTPKTQIGQHLEDQMIPKRGGGFDIIPIMKPDYTPDYIEQRVVITSNDIFTRNGEDIYVPVEYYGIPNPELK